MRKKLFCFALTALMAGILLCGCRHPRPEFDTVLIAYQDNSTETVSQWTGPDIQVIRESKDPAVLDELWDIYANLEVYNINRPMGLPRYEIAYLKDGAVVEAWLISHDWVVCGGRFGTNHTLENTVEYTGDSTWYNRITELFESCESQ